MPRGADLELLAVAALVALAVGLTAARLRAPRRIGAAAVLVAVAVAVAADRSLLHALPERWPDGRSTWVSVLAVALVAAGARRLPVAPTVGLAPVVPLGLAALAGVWLGVPETSAALVAAGGLAGTGLALLVTRAQVRASAVPVLAALPVAATWIGAAGEGHALAGGLLAVLPLALVGVGPPVARVGPLPLAVAVVLHGTLAVVAARHVGVARGGDSVAGPLVVVTVLAVVEVIVLRRGQRRVS